MGAPWDPQDPHAGHGQLPKLILAGRLTGSFAGSPVVIEAGDSGLIAEFGSFTSAWAARRTTAPLMPVLRSLQRLGVPLAVRIAGLVSFDVLPRPGPIARLLLPGLAAMGR